MKLFAKQQKRSILVLMCGEHYSKNFVQIYSEVLDENHP